VFPVQPTPAPDGTVIPMHFVPTTVARGPDGAFYVGQLTGFPFPVGGARVWRVEPGSAPTVYASGFTNIIDIAFDRRGRLCFRRPDRRVDPRRAFRQTHRDPAHWPGQSDVGSGRGGRLAVRVEPGGAGRCRAGAAGAAARLTVEGIPTVAQLAAS
jgi:hypothetical protein